MAIAVEVARVAGAKLSGSFEHIRTSGRALFDVLNNMAAYARREKKKILAEARRNKKRLRVAGILI